MGSEEDEKDKKDTVANSNQIKPIKEKNPLVVDLEPDVSSKMKADQWFQKVQEAMCILMTVFTVFGYSRVLCLLS